MATANHYLLDVFAGIVVAGLAVLVLRGMSMVTALRRRRVAV
jgi:hypothetical protein